jgi:hypothetical protein
MIRNYIHRWEDRLAEVSRHERIVRPFEWGQEWIETASEGSDPEQEVPRGLTPPQVSAFVARVMQDTDAFYTPEPTTYTMRDGVLSFPTGFTTPHPENNLVRARYFPARGGATRRAVVVLAQWNADSEGHVGLCKLLSKLGIASLRISLPYHDQRMPPHLRRAEYIVSANVVRTLQVCRQAVRDVRLALWWLRDQGYERLGLLGTSLGSCLAMLTACHEPLVKTMALNHVSPYFSDVVWRGPSTAHVRQGLEGQVTLDALRELWAPINPWSFLERMRGKDTLMVYAMYDTTFPPDLSRQLIEETRRRAIPIDVRVLPCGHYTTGAAPFKYLDAWYLSRFLAARL